MLEHKSNGVDVLLHLPTLVGQNVFWEFLELNNLGTKKKEINKEKTKRGSDAR